MSPHKLNSRVAYNFNGHIDILKLKDFSRS